MSADYQIITQGYVNIFITSTLTSFQAEKRFPKDVTIASLKGKLELIAGANPANMKLQLLDKDGNFVGALDNDDAMLGSYPIDDGMKIHVIDTSEKTKGEFEDVSKVEKFEISEDEYAKRAGKTEFQPGYWVGVQYDEPLGKNDGSVKGKRYFTCQPKFGGFVKPQFVTVGDFPIELDEEMDEM